MATKAKKTSEDKKNAARLFNVMAEARAEKVTVTVVRCGERTAFRQCPNCHCGDICTGTCTKCGYTLVGGA